MSKNINTMKDIHEILIVLVGNWNVKIFTPAWILNELLGFENNEDLNVRISKDLMPIYVYKGITLVPTDRFIEIRFNEINEEKIKLAIDVTLKILAILPYTPNKVVGFNYTLKEKWEFANIPKEGMITGFNLSEIRFKKQENDCTCTILMKNEPEPVIQFNFEYKDIDQIKEDTIQSHIKYIKSNGNN